MTPSREEVDHAFSLLAGIVEPETRGEARDRDVIAARDAMQALYLLRQWARAGARKAARPERRMANVNPPPPPGSRRPMPPPPPPPSDRQRGRRG